MKNPAMHTTQFINLLILLKKKYWRFVVENFGPKKN